MWTDKATCRREGDAAVAAFLASGGKITLCPMFRPEGARHTGKVAETRRRLPGAPWCIIIRSSTAGHIAAYGDDHPGMPKPRAGSSVTFERAVAEEGRFKAVRVRRADAE
jgi:hypothetical protein